MTQNVNDDSCPPQSAVDARRRARRILSEAEVIAMPPMKYVVDSLIPANSLTVLFGPTGAYKTTMAIDLAMSVASGTPFYGRNVQKGDVVYVCGEGFHGYSTRVAAWKNEHDVSSAGVYFTDDAVQMLDPNDVASFIEDIRAHHIVPHLIVLDTLSRCFAGGDENAQRDMSLFVRSADRLRREFDASIVVIHHTGHNAKRERGSSVLRSDFDAMLSFAIGKDQRSLDVSCVKMRDDARFDAFSLSFAIAHGAAVLRAFLSENETKTLAVLVTAGGDGLHFVEWREAAHVADSTLSRAKTTLMAQDYVKQSSERGAYVATEKAFRMLGASSPHESSPRCESVVVEETPLPHRSDSQHPYSEALPVGSSQDGDVALAVRVPLPQGAPLKGAPRVGTASLPIRGKLRISAWKLGKLRQTPRRN